MPLDSLLLSGPLVLITQSGIYLAVNSQLLARSMGLSQVLYWFAEFLKWLDWCKLVAQSLSAHSLPVFSRLSCWSSFCRENASTNNKSSFSRPSLAQTCAVFWKWMDKYSGAKFRVEVVEANASLWAERKEQQVASAQSTLRRRSSTGFSLSLFSVFGRSQSKWIRVRPLELRISRLFSSHRAPMDIAQSGWTRQTSAESAIVRAR